MEKYRSALHSNTEHNSTEYLVVIDKHVSIAE